MIDLLLLLNRLLVHHVVIDWGVSFNKMDARNKPFLVSGWLWCSKEFSDSYYCFYHVCWYDVHHISRTWSNFIGWNIVRCINYNFGLMLVIDNNSQLLYPSRKATAVLVLSCPCTSLPVHPIITFHRQTNSGLWNGF